MPTWQETQERKRKEQIKSKQAELSEKAAKKLRRATTWLKKKRESFWHKVGYAELPPTPFKLLTEKEISEMGAVKGKEPKSILLQGAGTTKAEEETRAKFAQEQMQFLGETLALRMGFLGTAKVVKGAAYLAKYGPRKLVIPMQVPPWMEKFVSKRFPKISGKAVHKIGSKNILGPRYYEAEYNRLKNVLRGPAGVKSMDPSHAGYEGDFVLDKLKRLRKGLKWYETVKFDITPKGARLIFDPGNVAARALGGKEMVGVEKFDRIYDAVKALSKKVPKALPLDIPELKYIGTVGKFLAK